MSNQKITLGYWLDKWQNYGLREPIEMSLARSENTHFMGIGASGSGKSYALHRAVAQLHEAEPHGEIIFANFKGDETFSYLNGLPRYFQYKDVFAALDIVYSKLCARLSGEDMSENPVTFIFDEYVSAVLSQQAEDKKAATQTMSRISEILLMGRACGRASVRFWCFTQRCDSAVFPLGSREQFGTVIALSNISKELKTMIFSEFPEDFENKKRFKRGEGRILQNGAHLSHIKIPQVRDMEAVKALCRAALSKPL
ncbi:MAG: hypothetical protein FWD48_09020 [Oscillospiraceae bacterium]|nr:hypothetical protein [Oscillospiraceae bacterium]